MNRLLLLALSVISAAHAATYYVATNGNDSASGTFTAPWRTLQKAATTMGAGDTCLIRGGVYREAVVPANSGTAVARIAYRAFTGETAIINGCEPLTNWTQVASNIWRAPLAGNFYTSLYNFAMQVFLDGRMLHQARWPNGTRHPSFPVKSSLTANSIAKWRTNNWTYVIFDDANVRPVATGYYVGAGIYVQPNTNAWSWTLSGTVISQVGTRLTIRTRNDNGKDGDASLYPAGSRYYLYGLQSMLDDAYEWYHDTTGGWLYVWLPDGVDPRQQLIEVKKRDWGFDLSNRSFITLDGLQFFACAVTTDRAAGGDGVGYNPDGTPRYPWRGSGSIAPSYNNVFENITARYLTHFTDVSGHFFMQWGQGSGFVISGTNHLVRNCVLQFSAGNGISTIGRGNRIERNVIQDVNYMSVDCSAINTGGAATSDDHVIAFNTIARCGRSGITPRLLRNSTTNLIARINHNDIMECMLQDWDGGGVYFVHDARFLRIDHNWVHDMSGYTCSGIYPDWSKNVVIDHNVIWNLEWGIHLQSTFGGAGTGNFLVYNNTIAVKNTSGFTYGPFGIVENSSQTQVGTVLRNNITCCYTNPPAPGYRPRDDFSGAEISHNLFTTNVLDPRFTDAYGFVFTLQPTSPARDTGAWIPNYTRDGVLVPGYNDPTNGAPDKGAYEFGEAPWRGGVTGPEWLAVTVSVSTTATEFVLTRSDDRAPLLVDFTLGGTATQDVHYASETWSVAFPAGALTQSVPLTILSGDTLNKTVTLTIAPGSTRYTVGTPGAATIVLVPEPELAVALTPALARLMRLIRR